MSIFREWHDFVTYPLDPDAVVTEQRRLRTDDATITTYDLVEQSRTVEQTTIVNDKTLLEKTESIRDKSPVLWKDGVFEEK
jgi:hypothetical protein